MILTYNHMQANLKDPKDDEKKKKKKKKKYIMPVVTDIPSTSTDVASASADTASASSATPHMGRAQPVLDTLRKPFTTSNSKVQECSCVSVAFCEYRLALQ